MIRRCTDDDLAAVQAIINDAARAYQGVVPADCWYEPYMPCEELRREVTAGVAFWGWEEKGELLGVTGLQTVRDVTLIRHAYVRTAYQGRGIGSALLTTLGRRVEGRLLVGTWAAASWAIRFYEKHGFRQVPTAEKERLLRTYWIVPERQIATSVVLTRQVQDACAGG